jgi:hypothetical protein
VGETLTSTGYGCSVATRPWSATSGHPLFGGHAEEALEYPPRVTFPHWLRTFDVAVVGAFLGLLYDWTTSTGGPEPNTRANGREVMRPVYVTPTPWS